MALVLVILSSAIKFCSIFLFLDISVSNKALNFNKEILVNFIAQGQELMNNHKKHWS